jgi:carbonic anhydrase
MTASNFGTYIERNAQFAATDAKDHVPEIPFIPSRQLYLTTCIDPRVDPAATVRAWGGDCCSQRRRARHPALDQGSVVGFCISTRTCLLTLMGSRSP